MEEQAIALRDLKAGQQELRAEISCAQISQKCEPDCRNSGQKCAQISQKCEPDCRNSGQKCAQISPMYAPASGR